jgi:hypothetical protein
MWSLTVPELPLADRPNVVLPAAPDGLVEALAAALESADQDGARAGIEALTAQNPTSLDCWAAVARAGRSPIERYAAARVGYHRGLDALRANGWGGVGWCRWEHPTNRGMLSCLALLGRAAGEIGETAEVTRIADFLTQLDPAWSDANVA